MNPMELVYFGENGRLNLDHDCEMCNEYPVEDMNEPCLACGYAKVDLIEVNNRITETNRAVDFFNAKSKDNNSSVTAIHCELTLSHVSLGGTDCDKIVLSDLNDSEQMVSLFAPFVRHDCEIVVYPKGLNDWLGEWGEF